MTDITKMFDPALKDTMSDIEAIKRARMAKDTDAKPPEDPPAPQPMHYDEPITGGSNGQDLTPIWERAI